MGMSQIEFENRGADKVVFEHVTMRSNHDCEVVIDGQHYRSSPCPPSRESLQRRFETSEKLWIQNWSEDEVDPTTPD